MRRAARLAALLVLGVACGDEAPQPRGPSAPVRRTTATELISLLPHTESAQETKAIDFGTPVGAAHLISGWTSEPPRGAPGLRSVAYLRQPHGRLVLHFRRITPRALELRCQAVQALRQSIRVALRLNGQYVGVAFFDPTPKVASVKLAAGAQRAGRNELHLRASLPPNLPPRLNRRLAGRVPALACDWIRVRGGSSAGALARLTPARDGEPELLLAPGATAAWYVRLGPNARLRVGPAAVDAAADADAEVRVQQVTPAGETTSLFGGPLGPAERRFALAGSPGDVTRVEISASGRIPVRLRRLSLENVRPDGRPTTARPRARDRPNVLLYVVDTLRADRLGCYGGDPHLSPHIDALAAEGVLFADAQSQASWTRPAVASIFTGLAPKRHGAVKLTAQLSSPGPTLAEVLRNHGYDTAGLVTNMNVSPRFGFARGFDHYRHLMENMQSRRVYAPARVLHRAALEWIAAERDRPFFLYLHASDPHAPYTPSHGYARRFERLDLRPPQPNVLSRPFAALGRNRREASEPRAAWLRSRYDAEVAELDAEIGRLVAGLRAAGVLERTLVVLVADHGEEFFEHQGFSHGRTLYQEQLHVPLVIRFPARAHAGTRVAALARQIDVLPTVLEYLDLPIPDDIDGESLVPLLDDPEAEATSRVALSHTALGTKDLSSVTTEDWQVIFGRSGGRRPRGAKVVEAFDRRTDPGERVDVATPSDHRVAYARQVVDAGTGSGTEAVPVEQTIGTETLQKLRALGYVSP